MLKRHQILQLAPSKQMNHLNQTLGCHFSWNRTQIKDEVWNLFRLIPAGLWGSIWWPVTDTYTTIMLSLWEQPGTAKSQHECLTKYITLHPLFIMIYGTSKLRWTGGDLRNACAVIYAHEDPHMLCSMLQSGIFSAALISFHLVCDFSIDCKCKMDVQFWNQRP